MTTSIWAGGKGMSSTGRNLRGVIVAARILSSRFASSWWYGVSSTDDGDWMPDDGDWMPAAFAATDESKGRSPKREALISWDTSTQLEEDSLFLMLTTPESAVPPLSHSVRSDVYL